MVSVAEMPMSILIKQEKNFLKKMDYVTLVNDHCLMSVLQQQVCVDVGYNMETIQFVYSKEIEDEFDNIEVEINCWLMKSKTF